MEQFGITRNILIITRKNFMNNKVSKIHHEIIVKLLKKRKYNKNNLLKANKKVIIFKSNRICF